MDTVQNWALAARSFAELIERLPARCWDDPGLGHWTVRDLVGHATSAGIITVAATLDNPAEREVITTPEGYYALGKTIDRATYDAAVTASTEDAQRTGRSLGANPAPTVRSLVETAIDKLDSIEESSIINSAAGGMQLGVWLQTRAFELAVHTLDIGTAAALPAMVPDEVLADALALAGRTAAVTGYGIPVLLAMTGRRRLPHGFSIV